MLKLLMKHKELEDLHFNLKEYGQFMLAGDIRYPDSYALVLRVKLLKRTFYINISG